MLYYITLMLYIFYPNKNIHINKELATKDNPYIEYKDEGGYVGNEIAFLYKKRKFTWLYLKVVDFLDKLSVEDDLTDYFKLELLSGLGDGLNEMRIPKTDRRGVFRIYYCDSELERENGASILLDAEYKDGEPKKIETGRARRREYLEEIKKERKNGKN